MKKNAIAHFPGRTLKVLAVLALSGGLFIASCEKEEAPPPPPPVEEIPDEIIGLPGDEQLVSVLLQPSGSLLIGYLDFEEKVLFADFEHLETLKKEFQAKDAGGIWVIEKNGQMEEYFLAPLAELNPEKVIKKEDEIVKKNEWCKPNPTRCFYGRTHQQWFRFTSDPGPVCVVRQDSVCTGKKKEFELELHSEQNCVTADVDEQGNKILKKITLTVCSR